MFGVLRWFDMLASGHAEQPLVRFGRAEVPDVPHRPEMLGGGLRDGPERLLARELPRGVLRRERILRHGFNVVGVRQGRHGLQEL